MFVMQYNISPFGLQSTYKFRNLDGQRIRSKNDEKKLEESKKRKIVKDAEVYFKLLLIIKINNKYGHGMVITRNIFFRMLNVVK